MSNSSKPVFQDVFKFEGRRNRQSYLLFQLASFAVLVVSAFVGIFGLSIYDNGGAVAVAGAALAFSSLVVFVAVVIAAWATSAQRVRDIGHSGAWCLLQLIPYIGWIFSIGILVMPGDTRESNKYGPSCIAE